MWNHGTPISPSQKYPLGSCLPSYRKPSNSASEQNHGADRVLIVPEDSGSHRRHESAARVDMFFQVSVGVCNYQGYVCFTQLHKKNNGTE